VIQGDEGWATAIAAPFGEKATPFPLPAGKVDGLANFVPNPAELQGYTEINGVVS
jgi:hypothetical protein